MGSFLHHHFVAAVIAVVAVVAVIVTVCGSSTNQCRHELNCQVLWNSYFLFHLTMDMMGRYDRIFFVRPFLSRIVFQSERGSD